MLANGALAFVGDQGKGPWVMSRMTYMDTCRNEMLIDLIDVSRFVEYHVLTCHSTFSRWCRIR